MANALASLEAVYADSTGPARAWKAQGGRSVGYFCDLVPVELIAAAGFLPVRITGDYDYDRAFEEKYVWPYIPKLFAAVRQAGVEFVNAMCVRLLSGVYDDLDYLIVPASRKPILNLLAQFRDTQRAFPEIRLPEIHILDHAHTPFESSREFNKRSCRALKAKLEAWSGKPITDEALAEAVRQGNQGRALIRQVNALRTASPPRLSGADFLKIAGAGMFMDRAAHNALLEQFLAEAPTAARSGPRVFCGGSPTENTLLYEAIEAAGATVVGEDHCWGERCADLPIDTAGGVVEGVINRWLAAPPCGLRFPLEASPNNVVARARAARADCVILSVYNADELQVWDTPAEMEALRKAGIPALHMRSQPYKIDHEKVVAEVKGFLSRAAAKVETA